MELDPALVGEGTVPRAPGMKYTHYAPSAPMLLVEADYPQAADILLREINRAAMSGRRVGAVVSAETARFLPAGITASVYGSREDKPQIAAGLYTALRYFDEHPVDVIYAEGTDETGLGLAVMNRLRKAAGYNIINS